MFVDTYLSALLMLQSLQDKQNKKRKIIQFKCNQKQTKGMKPKLSVFQSVSAEGENSL